MIQHVQDDHKQTNYKLSKPNVHAQKAGGVMISTKYWDNAKKTLFKPKIALFMSRKRTNNDQIE